MSSRRRRKVEDEHEENTSERWTVSYMDMVTVMMCLFIVLFAISAVDQQKFTELRDSLAAGFGDTSPATSLGEGSSGVLDGGEATKVEVAPIEGPENLSFLDRATDIEAARIEVNELLEVQEKIRSDLEVANLQDEVRFSITERGLVIGLVTENTFFSPASAAMPDTTLAVVDTVTTTLEPMPNDILLEGHANHLPGTRPYETNWELSADRATKVLRRMVEAGDIAPTRVRAIGYGDAYPVATDHPDALAINRRVDVVVLSDQPEQVRRLLPEVAAGEGT